MKRIYFDHAAATPTDPRVEEVIAKHLNETHGNPSSIHKEGVAAKKVLEDSRAAIAGLLGAHPDEIIFMGSATESCNLAIIGAVRAWKKEHPERVPHVITSVIEHDAVLAAVRKLEDEGTVATYISVDAHGALDLAALEAAITVDTVIISTGYANNEIGVIQPIGEIAKLIRRWKKEVRGTRRDLSPDTHDAYPLFHTDACQATNYLPMNVQKLGVDMMTINSAKIYGTKGVALLAKKRSVSLDPIVVGGGQEAGLRAGTENVPLIAGFSKALKVAEEMKTEEVSRLSAIRDHTIKKLSKMGGIVLNSTNEAQLPNMVNFSVQGASHEFLTIALDEKGFAVSTKSACNESDAETSHVLSALCDAGHNGEKSGIRLSFGRTTTEADVDAFVDALSAIREKLIVTAS